MGAIDAPAPSGAFVRCDLARDGTKWSGACSSYLPYQWFNKWSGNHVQWGRLQGQQEISVFTAKRIEGEAEQPKDIDYSKCQIKKTERMYFAWVPKN